MPDNDTDAGPPRPPKVEPKRCARCFAALPEWALYNKAGRTLPGKAQAGLACGACLEHLVRRGELPEAVYHQVAADPFGT